MFDYKKIIKSRELRLKILGFFMFIPDRMMVSIQYRIKTGQKLNLSNPKRYTEKLQWYKLYYQNALMPQCVDKYDVRQYVAANGYAQNLSKIFGIYSSVSEMDYESLPEKFVAKDTLGGGGASVIICKNKNKLEKKEFIECLQRWTLIHSKDVGIEWVYDNKPHRIIIEEYLMADEKTGGLIDYKFFCFNGHAEYLYVVADRKLGQRSGLGIFDMDFRQLPYEREDESPLIRKIEKPKNFVEMVEMAETLAKPFPHVRVDLYDINNGTEIRFGELTFYDGSGYMKFVPDKFDYIMGEKFILPQIRDE